MSWDIDGAGKEYLYEKKIEELKEQNKIMREALEYYTEVSNLVEHYHGYQWDFNDVEYLKRARKALEETK